ncbi:MAG TPA: ABC transporter substrate-binding protein [Streptosporangiaceae bacterium]|jgi:NitT/TauT family transport system substrate-binding protein
MRTVSARPDPIGAGRARRAVPLLAGALALVLTAAGCGGSGSGSGSANGLEKSTVTVGALPVVDFVALWVAKDKGLFKKQGLTVNIQIQSGGATAMPKLAAGSLDFSISNYVSAIQATESGTVPLKVLCDAYQLAPDTSGVLVPKDSPIKSAKDLAGKKIAVNTKANVGQLLVTAGLAQAGVQASGSQFSEVDFPQMVSALKTKSVDGAWTVEPFVTQIEEQLGGRLVLDTAKGTTADFPIGSYLTTQKFAKDNPKTTAAFTKAITAAQKMVAGDEKLVRQTLPSYSKIDAKTASKIKIATFPTSVSQARMQKVADLMTKYGFLKKHFDVKPML